MTGSTDAPATPRAPRVLVSGVVLGQPMGGVRRHNAELLPRAARLLAERGGELCVLEGSEPVAFPLPADVRRFASDVPPRPAPLRGLKEARALARVVAEERAAGRPIDLVHTAHLPAPRHLPVPFTLTLHDLRGLYLEHTPFSRRFFARHVIGRAVSDAALVITVSETVKRQLVTGFRTPPWKLAVVPNAADHFEPLPRAPGPDAPIVHLGHVEPRKNLQLLVLALEAAPDLPPLVLAGADRGDEGEELLEVAMERDVEDRITFAGPCADSELPRLFAGAGCVALPSRLEGFGIVALEAQRARVPLAISDAPALVEVAGEDVPRFGADDVAGCVRALRAALAQDGEVLEEHARRAARFSWARSAEALVAAWTAAAGHG